VKLSPVFSAVSLVDFSISRRTMAGIRDPARVSRPIHRIFTLLACISERRPKIFLCRPRMKSTSSLGRRQFSVEKPYAVSHSIPSASAERTISASRSSPWLCPSVRASPCRSAQRPLPSMITATWDGSGAGSVPER